MAFNFGLEGKNLPPRHPQYCFRLQNSVALQTSSIYHTSYKPQPSKCRPQIQSWRTYSPRGLLQKSPPPHKRRFLQSFGPSPQEGWNFSTCDRLEFSEQVRGKLSLPDGKHTLLKSPLQKGDYMTTLDLEDAYLSVPVHKDSQKYLQFLWRNKCYAFQGLCFGLNTAPRVFTKLLKPVAAFLSKRGVRMILYLDDFLILGSTYQEAQRQSHSYGYILPGKPRLHCQSGKVMFDSDPSDNIPGLCNRLHCRSTKPPSGESCEGEIPLLEGKGNSNYACSSNSNCTRHSRVMSPSNLVSSPSFSILANQNDPSSTFEQPEFRCDYYSGSRLFGRTLLVGVQHQLCERQPNKTSSSNVVYNNRRIQDRMGRSLRKSTHKRALVRQRMHPAHKCIGAQGCLSGP